MRLKVNKYFTEIHLATVQLRCVAEGKMINRQYNPVRIAGIAPNIISKAQLW